MLRQLLMGLNTYTIRKGVLLFNISLAKPLWLYFWESY